MHRPRSIGRDCGIGVLAWALVTASLFVPALAAPVQAEPDPRVEQILQRMTPDDLHRLVQSYAMMGLPQQPPGSIGAAG